MSSNEEVGFEVTEEIVIGDLSEIRDTRSIMPVASNVRGTIKKMGVRSMLVNNKEKEGAENPFTWRYLNVEVRLNGIEQEDGSVKYKNKAMFTGSLDLVLTHNAELKTTNWWKERKYALELRKFLVALGYDPKTPPAINDEFFAANEGREIVFDIKHKEKQKKDESGEYVGTGEFEEVIWNWKKAE